MGKTVFMMKPSPLSPETSMSAEKAQDRISLLIKAKMRETGLGVRASAKEASVSAATLSRLERGLSATLPDVATLEKLAKWLGTTVGNLLGDKEKHRHGGTPEATIPEIVEVHLRADKNLAPETAHALAKMFKALYNQASKKTI